MRRWLGSMALVLLLGALFASPSLSASGVVSSFSPAAGAFGSSGGAGAVTVTSSTPWTAENSDTWITITSPTSFSGDGALSYTVSRNETAYDRTGAIEVGGETFLVRQARADLADNVDTSSWSQQAVNAIYAAGITVGCGNNSFCKGDPVTREQMAAFLVRAVVGEDFSYTAQPYFADVSATGWSYKYVQKLKDLGLTSSSGTYNGAMTVTREQMAAFLIRAKFGENFSYPTTPYFSDVPDNGWSFKYVQKLKEQGYTSVTGNYGAADPVTREQMAAFLSRVFLGMIATYDVSASHTDNPLAGTYQGMALTDGAGSATIATFTYKIDGNGTVTGVCTDVTDGNKRYAFGGTANVGTGTIMFSFTLAAGNRITFSGTPTSGTWARSASQNNPAASGSYTASKALSTPIDHVKITAPASPISTGKTYQFSAVAYADADETIVVPTAAAEYQWGGGGSFGTVDSNGLFTAGALAGEVSIYVQHKSSTKLAYLTVHTTGTYIKLLSASCVNLGSTYRVDWSGEASAPGGVTLHASSDVTNGNWSIWTIKCSSWQPLGNVPGSQCTNATGAQTFTTFSGSNTTSAKPAYAYGILLNGDVFFDYNASIIGYSNSIALDCQ